MKTPKKTRIQIQACILWTSSNNQTPNSPQNAVRKQKQKPNTGRLKDSQNNNTESEKQPIKT